MKRTIMVGDDGTVWWEGVKLPDDRDEAYRTVNRLVREHGPARVNDRAELIALARVLGVRSNWHEPDEQSVEAHVLGSGFDNAGFWPLETGREAVTELYVALTWHYTTVAYVNLANLFAWASTPVGE